MGVNAMAQMDEQDELYMPNIDKEKLCDGNDKVFPYGTTITFRGKHVSCYVTST
jgi:hypothetical protein